MDKIEFHNNSAPAINDTNLNQMQENIEIAFTPELLWTNANPTSGVQADTKISINLTNYTSVKIIFKVDATTTTMGDSRYIKQEIDVGYRTNVFQITPYLNQASVVVRQRTYIVETDGITFSQGSKHTLGTASSYVASDDDVLIPYKIYGIR